MRKWPALNSLQKEMELIEKHLSKSDVCIATAQVFGRKAPTLIQEKMVRRSQAR